MVHILVVEDDRNTRKLMEAVLKRDGYSVHTAADGVTALALLHGGGIGCDSRPGGATTFTVTLPLK